MYIYKIERLVECDDYEDYSGAIVCANSVEHAQKIHPSGDNSCWGEYYDSWVESPKLVKVTLIGDAVKGIVSGTVLLAKR